MRQLFDKSPHPNLQSDLRNRIKVARASHLLHALLQPYVVMWYHHLPYLAGETHVIHGGGAFACATTQVVFAVED